MYFAYNLLLTIALIILWPLALIAFLVQPKFRAGFWQKLGFYQNISNPNTIWFHAVSVGEVNAVESLIKQTKKELPHCNIVLSTVTRTGQQIAHKKLSNTTDKIIYFPYDFALSVISAINAITPALVVIAETEIWPNFANELKKKNIPTIIVNGRISPSSYKGYKKFSFFFKNILSKYTSILMQTPSDKNRIISIGSNPDSTKVMGNLKFDIKNNTLTQEEIIQIAKSLNLQGEKVLIAGSTHKGEDEIVINVYERLKDDFDNLKLIIAPRHPERYEQVSELLEQSANEWGKRSNKDGFDLNDIIMLDTIGELGNLYSICTVAFIGGSFSNTGGHNPLEATIYNKPVISGNIVHNFKDIYEILTQNKAATLVDSEEAFYLKAKELLTDNHAYHQSVQACQSVFKQNGGALRYALDEIKSHINN